MNNPSMVVGGVDLVYRPGRDFWVACFGPDDVVHFMQLPSGTWKAHRPMGLEPIAVEKSLLDCIKSVQKQREIRQQKIKSRLKLILTELAN